MDDGETQETGQNEEPSDKVQGAPDAAQGGEEEDDPFKGMEYTLKPIVTLEEQVHETGLENHETLGKMYVLSLFFLFPLFFLTFFFAQPICWNFSLGN